MGEITYSNLLNGGIERYQNGDYMGAYNFITQNCMGVTKNEAQIYNFRYCFACKAGLDKLALEIMKEAIEQKDFWYSYEYIINDDDLLPLHKFNDFYRLAGICREREQEARENTKAEVKIISSGITEDGGKQKLIIALHGNEENIVITEDYWKACVGNNYTLALLQSSQIDFWGAYLWNDVERGLCDVKQQYDKVLAENCINSGNVIVGGFSAGTRTALYSMLNGVVSAKGFIFNAPWLPEIDEWEPLMDRLKGIRGYIICGEGDEECLGNVKKFVDMLNMRNIPNVFKIVKGLKHAYPDNFDVYLSDAIKFINA